MRFIYLFAALFLTSGLAQAAVNCTLTVAGDLADPNTFNKQIYTTSFGAKNGPQTTVFAIVKPDRTVVKMPEGDLSAFDGDILYTFQHATPKEYLISVGVIDTKDSKGPLLTEAYAVGGLTARGLSLMNQRAMIWAGCYKAK